jgi:hypothetical protein
MGTQARGHRRMRGRQRFSCKQREDPETHNLGSGGGKVIARQLGVLLRHGWRSQWSGRA